MKQPPSQRPMALLEVGQLYHPDRRSWTEGADYNWRSAAHELRIFLGHATPREVASVQTGRIEFGLMIELPELFLVSRFHGPDDRVLCSFDSSYQWHRVSADERTAPPAWEETSPDLRAVCTIILVEATNGIVLALRAVSYSPEFTRALHRAIADQADLPYDTTEHERAVADIIKRNTTDQLWARCAVRCDGGA